MVSQSRLAASVSETFACQGRMGGMGETLSANGVLAKPGSEKRLLTCVCGRSAASRKSSDHDAPESSTKT